MTRKQLSTMPIVDKGANLLPVFSIRTAVE